jgi:small subunit ribosomal protein S2
MGRVPAAVWIVDTKKEHLAVDEARKLKLPIIGILDTNCDPDEVDFPIPGNDDAIRSVGLLTRVVADAVADGLMSRGGQGAAAAGEELGAEEPLAAWERELLESQNGATTEAKADEAPAAEAAAAEAAAVEAPAAEAAVETPAVEAPAAEAVVEAPAAEAVVEAPVAEEAPAAEVTEAPAADEAPKTEA